MQMLPFLNVQKLIRVTFKLEEKPTPRSAAVRNADAVQSLDNFTVLIDRPLSQAFRLTVEVPRPAMAPQPQGPRAQGTRVGTF